MKIHRPNRVIPLICLLIKNPGGKMPVLPPPFPDANAYACVLKKYTRFGSENCPYRTLNFTCTVRQRRHLVFSLFLCDSSYRYSSPFPPGVNIDRFGVVHTTIIRINTILLLCYPSDALWYYTHQRYKL